MKRDGDTGHRGLFAVIKLDSKGPPHARAVCSDNERRTTNTTNMMMQNKGWLAILVDSVTRIIGYHNNEPLLPVTAPGGPSPPGPCAATLARDVWFPAHVSAQAPPVLPVHAIHVGQ
jgi:hypothetical protein